MAPDDLKARFAEDLKLRPAPYRYLDRPRERDLLRLALEQQVPVHLARTVLLTVCAASGHIVESLVVRGLRRAMQAYITRESFITEEAFRHVIASAVRSGRGQLSPERCQGLAIELIEGYQWPCKQGFFRRWYDKARKQAHYPDPV